MALTKTTIKWSGENADITIDGNTTTNVTSPYIVELTQGDHTCKIVEDGVTIYEDTLHVPKALVDRVEEEIQSRNLVTQTQLQAQIETALEASQGYIDIVEVKDESTYGQNGNETETIWSLYYKIVQPQGGSVPAKVKLIDAADRETINDVELGVTKSVMFVLHSDSNGDSLATIKEIQVLAGNNKVIDKLDLNLVLTETDEPNILYDKSSIEKTIDASQANFKIKPLKTEFKSYKINKRAGQLGGGSVIEITSDIATNGISINPNTDNSLEFYDVASRLLYKYYIDDDIKIVGMTNDGANFHIAGVSGQTTIYTVYADNSTRQNTWGVNDDYTAQPIESGADYMLTLNSVASGKDDGKLFYYSTAGVDRSWN
jgi:hypothetical protein